MASKTKTAWPWLGLSLLIILIDQISKCLVVHHLSFAEPYPLTSFFSLTLNFNTGAAFSFLDNHSGWQTYFFAVISLAVAVFLIVSLFRIERNKTVLALGISLIIGGALGNFLDRMTLRHVVDFLDFHVGTWHFDTFNIADSAISVGAALLILRLIFAPKKVK